MHPVGRHLDTFSDNYPSLENKVCFSFNLNKDGSTGIKNIGCPYGRGGSGLNRYIFAVLDWGSSNRSQRNAWIHPTNSALMYSAQWYTENGLPNQRCLVSVWGKFCNKNPNPFVPDTLM